MVAELPWLKKKATATSCRNYIVVKFSHGHVGAKRWLIGNGISYVKSPSFY